MNRNGDNMRDKKRALIKESVAAKSQIVNRCKTSSDGERARLLIPAGNPDIDALRSVTREWLVPSLVKKFLRLHGIDLKYSGNSASHAIRLLRPVISEDRGSGCRNAEVQRQQETEKRE